MGQPALQAFREATGVEEPPRKPGEPHWFEFLEFHREAFRKYLRRYIAEVKRTHPAFQLCSNWAFTDHMPEPVCAPVDFLSGDYSPDDSVNSARLSARYLARQGTPWDLMAWSFTLKPRPDGRPAKDRAATAARSGGGAGDGRRLPGVHKQKRDGSIYDEQMPVMAEVARFCRARQAFCHHAVQVPQVALLYSTAAHYRRVNGLFSRDLARINGILQALLESQQSVEVLGEHHLAGRLQEYPLIVVPEWEYLDESFKAELVGYVRKGGNLLLVGPRSAALFQTELDASLEDAPKSAEASLHFNGAWAGVKGEMQPASLGPSAQPFGRLHATRDSSSPSQPAASITPLGKGKIAATYFAFGQGYLGSRDPVAREFLDSLTRQLFPDRLVEVSGSHDVDVVVNKVDGKLALNLVNTAGPHQSEPILETIPPVGPLSVVVRQTQEPARVVLQPQGETVAFNYHRGRLQFTLPKLGIHDIVMIEPK